MLFVDFPNANLVVYLRNEFEDCNEAVVRPLTRCRGRLTPSGFELRFQALTVPFANPDPGYGLLNTFHALWTRNRYDESWYYISGHGDNLVILSIEIRLDAFLPSFCVLFTQFYVHDNLYLVGNITPFDMTWVGVEDPRLIQYVSKTTELIRTAIKKAILMHFRRKCLRKIYISQSIRNINLLSTHFPIDNVVKRALLGACKKLW